VITGVDELRTFREAFQFSTWDDNTASAVLSPTTCRAAYDVSRRLVLEAASSVRRYRAHLDLMDLAQDQYSFGDHAYRRSAPPPDRGSTDRRSWSILKLFPSRSTAI
jgi:hypothetical protein